ncbi:DUF2867 domain-containing protein [Acidovorax sp. DW039]|uniref:hypothetical protein n=1 Tax=Acidovorax sp. DW039 TaxID=3095606 RepID=UPI0030938B2A|nr:DUF2867 domain-containing protein [Acidovorax sp. DW039]
MVDPSQPRLIDHHLPIYQFVERHSLRVVQPLRDALKHVITPQVVEDPFALRMIALREAPARLARKLGLATRLPERPFGLPDFVLLERKGDEELVLGLAGRFWQPDYGLVPLTDATDFARIGQSGIPRLVLQFATVKLPDGSTLLSTETRVHCPDSASLRRFRPYWWLIRPVSGWIRRRMLQRWARTAISSAIAQASSSS